MADTDPRPAAPDFVGLPDLASRALGGGVVAANDELFAERENLIKPEPPQYSAYTFGHKGQVYDGWETRRRREPGHDWALVAARPAGRRARRRRRHGLLQGQLSAEVSVEGAAVEGHPSPEELAAADWTSLVPRSAVKGDAANEFAVAERQRWTHVRLRLYPDGGVARLRVHGEVVPDPRLLGAGAIDLAALANGAAVAGCSNMFYSSPANLLSPGLARLMGEGWETARRRDDGNDWVDVRLAGPGAVAAGRAGHQLVRRQRAGLGAAAGPGRARRDGRGGAAAAHPAAARHAAPLPVARRTRGHPRTHGRLSGRGHGPAPADRRARPGRPRAGGPALVQPACRRPQATEVLTAEGVPVEVAERTVAARPLGRVDDLPDGIRAGVGL